MYPLELVFSEQICRQALFRKTQECPYSQFLEEGNGGLRAWIGDPGKPILHDPAKVWHHKELFFLLRQRIRLQDLQGKSRKVVTEGTVQTHPFFDLLHYFV